MTKLFIINNPKFCCNLLHLEKFQNFLGKRSTQPRISNFIIGFIKLKVLCMEPTSRYSFLAYSPTTTQSINLQTIIAIIIIFQHIRVHKLINSLLKKVLFNKIKFSVQQVKFKFQKYYTQNTQIAFLLKVLTFFRSLSVLICFLLAKIQK